MQKFSTLNSSTRPSYKKNPLFDEEGNIIKRKPGRPVGSVSKSLLLKEMQVIPGATPEAPYGYTKRGKPRKRRSSEDVIQFNRPLVVTKSNARVYFPKKIQRRKKENSYLKYHRIIMAWARKKYKVSTIHLEMMFFLYDENIFTKTKFKEYSIIMPFDRFKLNRMINDGWVRTWRDDTDHRYALYELTPLAKRLVSDIYKMMNGELKISAFPSTNDLIDTTNSKQKMYNIVVKKINKNIDNENEFLRHESKISHTKPTKKSLREEQIQLDINS